MAKDIKDLQTADLTGKQVSYLAFVTKWMPKSRFDELWDYLLPLATPVGGYKYSVWKDFKENNANEILAKFKDGELLEVGIK